MTLKSIAETLKVLENEVTAKENYSFKVAYYYNALIRVTKN